ALERLRRVLARRWIAGAAREPGALGGVVGQRVRLPFRHHLHPVLQPAEEDVRLGKLVAIAARDEAREEQPVESGKGPPHAPARVLASVQELQRLHEELDFADAARAELQVLLAAPSRFALRARLERPHLLDGAEIEVLAPDERRE